MAEIPKPQSLSPRDIEIGWPRNLLLFSLMLLLFASSFALGLGAYRKILSDQNSAIEMAINDIVGSLRPDEAQKLLALDAQIKNLKRLLPAHIYPSRLFDAIELNTHPDVRLVRLTLNHSAREVALSGVAPSGEVVSQQASAYAAMKHVESLSLKSAVLGSAGYTFNFSLIYKPQLTQF